MEKDHPKLYALILQYLSEESLEEVKRSDDWDTNEQETDTAMLWDVIESTKKINMVHKVASVMKMAARTTYQQMRQGANKNIITYKEHFNNALKVYVDQGNPALDDKDIAMDFLEVSTTQDMLDLKQRSSTDLPQKAIGGVASTFTTTLDRNERPCGNQLSEKRRGEGKKKDDEQQGGGGNPKENNDRRAQVECFTCGELGHYANKCPTKKANNEDEDNIHAHVRWDASTFVTYQVHATGMVGKFK